MIGQVKSVVAELRQIAAAGRTRSELSGSGSGVRIDRTVHVRSPNRLTIGSGSFIDAGVVLHCGGMDWSPQDGGIRIGRDSYIGPNSVLFGAAGIDLGDSVLVSPGVVITSHQHTFSRRDLDIRSQSLAFGPVVIERDVWIGANATILPGVRLSEGAVVGAGAVVRYDVPARTVAVGVPARVIRGR
jgi:acetyltransferase-like isoleucine patch superfamily enzyme